MRWKCRSRSTYKADMRPSGNGRMSATPSGCFQCIMKFRNPKESFVQVEDLGTLMAVNVGWLLICTLD